jgi:hypothetical protein
MIYRATIINMKTNKQTKVKEQPKGENASNKENANN